MSDRTLAGRGGGKGDESAQRSPVESPDTLRSVAYARVLDLVSEGEIEGLVDGLKSVYLDGVPVQNADGTYNFKDVTVYDVKGLQSQEYIPGFPSSEAETAVGVAVTQAAPVVRQVSDAAVDAVRVTVEVAQLTQLDPDTGNLGPATVQIAIDLQSNGGGYVEQQLGEAAYFRGKCTSPYARTFRVELTGSAPWDIRVRRVSADSGGNVTSPTAWKSYTTVIDDKLSFPNSALVGVQVAAHQFQSVPTRSYLIKGLKVLVPANYDPATRAYTGVWDGTFKVAWTDNPAWCFYDLVTSTRYGLGKYVPAASVDKWGLYTIAQYCDELVDDGNGGTEPRFTCNLYLQTQEEAFRVVANMASIFRGMVYWASGAVHVSQDAPKDPEYLFTPANVVDGEFVYSGSGRRARHTVAIVSWNDPQNHYKIAREFVTDEEGLRTRGYNPTEVAALGCTSRGQAHRLGKWLLYTERMETETVVFRTGLEGASRTPGAIVKVQDPYRAGKRLGGRLAAVAPAYLTLDAEVDLEAAKTYKLSCILPDGTLEERDVSQATPHTTSGNMLPDPERFDAPPWTLSNITLTSRAGMGPDGSPADLAVLTAAGVGSSRIEGSPSGGQFTTEDAIYVAHIWIKALEVGQKFRFGVWRSGVGFQANVGPITLDHTDWHRVEIVTSQQTAGGNIYPVIYPAGDSVTQGQGCYVWGAAFFKAADDVGSAGLHRVVRLKRAFSQPPVVNGIWVLTASDLAPTTYRVLSVAEPEPGVYEVTALRHEPTKYDLVENDVHVQLPPTTALPSALAPSGLALSETLFKKTTGLHVILQARWDQNQSATGYVVRWKRGTGNWTTEPETQTHFWELRDIPTGTYHVQVAAVVNGFMTSFSEATYAVLGKAAAPADVTGLTASLNGNTATIRWNEIADLDRDMYEIRHGSTWAGGTFVAKVRATSHEWAVPTLPATYNVMVKAIDTTGNYSNVEASVSLATAPTVPGTVSMSVSSVAP